MFFSKLLMVPASTSGSLPVTTTLKVTAGTVRHVWIWWRYGEGGLCGVRMFYHEFQHWPLSAGEWIPSSYFPLDFAEGLALGSDPYELRIEAYNLDDTFPHKLWVAFEVEREKSNNKLFGFLGVGGTTSEYG